MIFYYLTDVNERFMDTAKCFWDMIYLIKLEKVSLWKYTCKSMNKVTCQQTHSANIHIVTLDGIGKVIPKL